MSRDAVSTKPVIIHEGAHVQEQQATLLIEEPLEIRINGAPYAVIMRTPGNEMELAAGFCLTEGIIDSFSEIHSIGFCADAPAGMQNIVNVMVSQNACGREEEAAEPSARAIRKMASRSSCGLCGVEMLQDVEKKTSPLLSDLKIPAGNFYRMLNRMLEFQKMYGSTRSAHAAGIFYPGGEPIVVREDVGRHNALDKVIGHALIKGLDCSRLVALLSSRISFEMVQKALRARIPVVAAVSAATSLAVDLAERNGCTLIGRIREESIIIYTHPDRIVA